MLGAILPIFLLILLGALLRPAAWLGESFWAAAERLTYLLLFPALLVTTLAGAELGSLGVARFALALILVILLISLGLIAARPWLALEGPAFTSAFQATIRFNTYIALAASFALAGAPGLTAAALAVAVVVPTVNLLCVFVLARYGGSAPKSGKPLLGAVTGNPLILACALGILLNASGLGLPPILGPALEILGRGALPLGLLAVGAGLRFEGLAKERRTLAVTASLKLLIMPAATALACHWLGVTGTPAMVAVLYTALPPAPSAYILARQLGGDAGLMARLIAAHTLLSLATIPLVLALFT
jgi:malonate transporter